jgi:uncharacterized protein
MKNNGKRVAEKRLHKNFRFLFFLAAVMVLSVLFSALCMAGSADKVIDGAGLFKAGEMQKIQAKIAETAKATNMDVVVVTTKSKNGKTAEQYADDVYDQGGYGTGTKKSGFLYLIDMEGRKIYISTAGGAITLLTDKRIDAILDDAFDQVKNGQYADSAVTVLNDAEKYYADALKSGYQYNADTGVFVKKKSIRPLEALLAILISFLTAGGYCLGIKNRYEMKSEKKNAIGSALAYRAAAAFAFALAADELINSHTSERIIQTNQGSGSGGSGPFGSSSTHTSSGGETHGGGGRSF